MLEVLGQKIHRWRWELEEGMPIEIHSGRLLLCESPIWTLYPIPLYGIPDQVYVTTDGELLVVDTKTRPELAISLRDAVQLSVYRAILVYTRHPLLRWRAVRPYGYVRLCWKGRVNYVRVQLYAVDAILTLALAYYKAPKSRSSGARDQEQYAITEI